MLQCYLIPSKIVTNSSCKLIAHIMSATMLKKKINSYLIKRLRDAANISIEIQNDSIWNKVNQNDIIERFFCGTLLIHVRLFVSEWFFKRFAIYGIKNICIFIHTTFFLEVKKIIYYNCMNIWWILSISDWVHCLSVEAAQMMNYRKGRNVEEELTRNDIPIENLPEDFLWMHVSSAHKMGRLEEKCN